MTLSAPNVGRASCHIRHTKSIAGRRGTLDEMMREIVPGAVERYAKKNPNIMVAEEADNESYVNDGEGGFRPCEDIREVMDYGDARAARLSRKITKDRKNKRGEMRGGTVTTTTFLVHLPRTLCDEVPDFYPAIDPRTGKRRIDPETGELASRSRWVAKDRDEAERYFNEVLEYLAANVVPGGVDGILGISLQYSENTPHMHVLADTFGDDPKHPGSLRQDWSRAYSEHRDVRDEDGRRVPGWEKIRDLHVGLREHLIAKGFDIERESSERSTESLAKAEYVASMQALETAEETLARVAKLEPEARAEAERLVKAARQRSSEIISDAQTESADILDEAERDAQTVRSSAREAGRQEGRAEGQAEARRLQQAARERLAEADATYAEAMTASSIPDHQVKYLAFSGANILASEIKKRVDPQTSVMVDKVFTSVKGFFNRNTDVLIDEARKAERLHGNKLVSKRVQVQEAQKSLEDDGMEF